MLELIFKNRIPQHEKSNDRTTKEFHVKNWEKKTLHGFSLQNKSFVTRVYNSVLCNAGTSSEYLPIQISI